jgi:hypothetical protein
MTPKIVTHHWSKPILTRSFDWTAFYDGHEEDGDCGYGRTEQEAIDDLVNNCDAPE